MAASPSQEAVVATREARIAEAKRAIDAAGERHLLLRLVGGLAVRFRCKALDFCEREYGDIDMVGHRKDANRIASLFADLGYPENMHVRLATEGRQLQFARGQEPTAENDHIDVFLDTFKMEHAIDLTERLDTPGYTITGSDLLLTKLQMTRLEEKDERDVFTLLQDVDLGSAEDPLSIDPEYIARLCAHDWGLFHDVQANLTALRARLDGYGSLTPEVRDRVSAKLLRLQETIEAEPKPAAWRLRARVGTRLPWHDEVEEQD